MNRSTFLSTLLGLAGGYGALGKKTLRMTPASGIEAPPNPVPPEIDTTGVFSISAQSQGAFKAIALESALPGELVTIKLLP